MEREGQLYWYVHWFLNLPTGQQITYMSVTYRQSTEVCPKDTHMQPLAHYSKILDFTQHQIHQTICTNIWIMRVLFSLSGWSHRGFITIVSICSTCHSGSSSQWTRWHLTCTFAQRSNSRKSPRVAPVTAVHPEKLMGGSQHVFFRCEFRSQSRLRRLNSVARVGVLSVKKVNSRVSLQLST